MHACSSASSAPTRNAPRRSRVWATSPRTCVAASAARSDCASLRRSSSGTTRASPTQRTSNSCSRRCGRIRTPTRPTLPPLPPMRESTTDGLLLVDKPAGMTSHDVVLAARRAFGESRIGHAGTLDPFATGLLVLLLGRATRLLPYLDGVPKEYEATIALGTETETDDLLGAVVREAAAPPDDAIAEAIDRLTGPLEQVPPNYSAKRIAG